MRGVDRSMIQPCGQTFGVQGNLPGAPSTTTPLVKSRVELVDGHQAVLGEISVNGKILDILLSDGSFNRSREDQVAFAKRLGYRLATREEHEAYVDGLLAKEEDGTINDAEKRALETYRDNRVRDSEGNLDVDKILRRSHSKDLDGRADRGFGAFFVRDHSASITNRNT